MSRESAEPTDPGDDTEPGEPDEGPGTRRAAEAALGTDDPEALQTDLGGGPILEDPGWGT